MSAEASLSFHEYTRAGASIMKTRPSPAQSQGAICSTGRLDSVVAARRHEEFKRRIKTQTVLPSVDTTAMLFWALLASGQINMRKVDGWQTLATKPIDQPISLAA